MIVQDASIDGVDDLRANTQSEERRSNRRHAQSLPLTLSVFNQDTIFKARMVNYSPEGVCVEACQCILPGTSIYLRIDKRPAATSESVVCHCFRTTALGEVKWCQASGQDPPQRYLIGIRYYSYY